MRPATRYAHNGDVHLAYQVIGSGPIDLLFAHGWVSHVEAQWKFREIATFLRRLGRGRRLIVFDKRGCGMSDRTVPMATMEQRADDVRAVMDAAGSERAVVIGVSESVALTIQFAATNPQRTAGLVAYGGYARRQRTPDYPWAPTPAERRQFLDTVLRDWGGPMDLSVFAPSRAADVGFVTRFAEYLRQSASPGAAHEQARMNTYVDVREALPLVQAPTLILHRERDRGSLVDEGHFIAKHIPGARFALLPGADHWPFVGDSASILDAIEMFVDTLPAQSLQPPRPARVARRSSRRTALRPLSPRQREILTLMAQGHSNREIARLLARSEHTIHRHVANILTRLNVNSRVEAVALQLRQEPLP